MRCGRDVHGRAVRWRDRAQAGFLAEIRPVALAGRNAALTHLAPYVFQVAISNRRIVSLENDQVSFV